MYESAGYRQHFHVSSIRHRDPFARTSDRPLGVQVQSVNLGV